MIHELSPIQKFFNCREQIKRFSSSVYVGCQLIDSYNIDIVELQKLVREIIIDDNNKQLLAQIKTRNATVHLLDIDSVDFTKFVYVLDDSAFTGTQDENLVYEMVKKKFDTDVDVPQWRLVYLPKLNYLIFNFGHVFFDGMSGVNFMKLVMDKLEHLEVKGSVIPDYHKAFDRICVDKSLLDLNVIDVYPRATLNFQNVYSIIRHKIVADLMESIYVKLVRWFPYLLRFTAFQYYNRFQTQQKPLPGKHLVNHKLINISSADTRKLIGFCRQNNFTLNTLIVTLFALTSPKSTEPENFVNNIDIPFNLRTRIPEVSQYKNIMAMLVAPASFQTPIITPLSRWGKNKDCKMNVKDYVLSYASTFDNSIKTEIESFKPLKAMSLISLFAPKMKETQEIMDYKSFDVLLPANPSLKNDFEVSNLGLFHNYPLVKDAIFNQSHNMRPSHMTASVIGSVKGGTNISCMYSNDDFPHDYLTSWHVRFEGMVKALLSEI